MNLCDKNTSAVLCARGSLTHSLRFIKITQVLSMSSVLHTARQQQYRLQDKKIRGTEVSKLAAEYTTRYCAA